MSKKTKLQLEAEKVLWSRGNLRHKLYPAQQKIYDQFYTGQDYITTMLISRQFGKSFLMCTIAVETCLRTPRAIVKYVCPTKEMVKTIVQQNVEQIIDDCPLDIKPVWKESEKCYIFKNGSKIQIAGSDGKHYNRIRGGRSHLWIVDEAGFCKELKTIVRSVLIPTTTTTKGRGLMASTPDPDHPDHDFISEFVEPTEAQGKLFKYTIFDHPTLTKAEIDEIISYFPGGLSNTQFQAEYMCKVTRNSESIVIPEFDAVAEKEIVTDKYRIPPFFDSYVSMDIGGKDFTVVLFGFYDFLNDTLVVEDELVLRSRQNSLALADGINRKIESTWGFKKPYLMFADNNNVILLNDLAYQHDLRFIPTKKDNKEAAINTLRVKVQNRKIVINPRCKTLIYHLKNATWSKNATIGNYKKFGYGADGSHFDAVDALLYMTRNIVYGKNPYPSDYNGVFGESSHTRYGVKKPTEREQQLLKIFKRKF